MTEQEFGNFVNKIIEHCKSQKDCGQCDFLERDYCKICQYFKTAINTKEYPDAWSSPIWAIGITDDDKKIMKEYLVLFPDAKTFIRTDKNTYTFENQYTTIAKLQFNPFSVNIPINYPFNIKHYFLDEEGMINQMVTPQKRLKKCPFCGCPMEIKKGYAIYGKHTPDCYFTFIDQQDEYDFTQIADLRKLWKAWNQRKI